MSQGKDTLNEWLDYILSSHPENVIELGLTRMKKMLDRHFECLAGTNGKGSTLRPSFAAGYKMPCTPPQSFNDGKIKSVLLKMAVGSSF